MRETELSQLNRRGCLAAVLGVLLLGGCGRSVPTAREALIIARAFVDALLLLEAASKLFRVEVIAAVRSVKFQLGAVNDTSVKLPQVAVEWEEKWAKVTERTGELEEQFADVEAKSGKYWDVLDKVTNAIVDPAVRQIEEIKNAAARIKWQKAHAAAAMNILRAKTLRDRGDDMKRTMLATVLRSQIAEYTAALDSIAREADSLMTSMESLTEQGRALVTLGRAGRA